MDLKTIEVILLAAGALITAAKWIVKFIGYVGKLLKQKSKLCAALRDFSCGPAQNPLLFMTDMPEGSDEYYRNKVNEDGIL
jgi:hypothetical protein